jgi:hypothetical protein
MWPYLIPAAIGGLMSGAQAYQTSGGDISKTLGATALGAGLGAGAGALGGMAAGAAGRFAGGLADTPLVQQLLQKAVMNPGSLTAMEQGILTTANIAKPAAAAAAGLGVELIGSHAVPKIATALAPSTSGLAQGAGVAQRAVQGGASGAYTPPIAPNLTNQYGPRTYADVVALNSPERGQVARGVLDAEGQLQQMKILDPYTLSMIDKAATSDLYRSAAGAQLRAALTQGVQGMNQAQVGAQALAQQSNQALMNAASTRGGYV